MDAHEQNIREKQLRELRATVYDGPGNMADATDFARWIERKLDELVQLATKENAA